MEVFFTGDEFVIEGKPHRGIPFLLDQEMREVVAVNDYLFHIGVIRGRTASPATWKTYANDLYDYFSYLEANELKWRAVTPEQIAVWRNAMIENPSALTGAALTRSTINQRIRTVARFYEWSATRGLIEQVPFTREAVAVSRPRHFFAHTDTAGGKLVANALTLRQFERPPAFLSLEQLPVFIAALRPKRNQLMAWMMVEMGLRREEAAGFACAVLPNPIGHSDDQMLKVTLVPTKTPTKGGRERWVQMSPQLAGVLWQYRQVDRTRLARLYRAKHGTDTDRLFLTEYGDPVSPKGLNNAFRKASEQTGIHCTPHMLRHTFGTYELLRLEQRMNQGNALLWVKERMGHRSIQTTLRYAHLATALDQQVLDAYQENVSAMMIAALHG